MTTIYSWNILYRPYEERYNPKSDIIQKYPDDRERTEEILQKIDSILDQNSIMCLQECSEDVLICLDRFSETHDIHTFNVRDKEYLVTLSAKRYKMIDEKITSSPSANGVLSVANDVFRVVNLHLIPQRYIKDIRVLDTVGCIPTDHINIIAGDFNENKYKLRRYLGDCYHIPDYGNTYKNRGIDNIIFDKIVEAMNLTIQNIPACLLSDHNMISAEIS